MRILWLIFGRRVPSSGILASDRAFDETDSLIDRMREASQSKDAFRAVMADLWAQRHNIPYMTTMFEANAEMRSAVIHVEPQDDDSAPS
jgi:hypothetical protein